MSPSSETELQSTRVIALVSDITELEVTQSKLRKQALYDGLTGLANRRLFREHLQLLVSECPDLPFAVCFLDLDDFKHVNDSAGHNAGDLLLQGVARRIEEVLGSHAFVARFGGDEFAVTLPGGGSDSTAIQDKIDELLIAFREPFNILGTEAVVGLSIGVTHYPLDGSDADTLMCNADIAMYAAKSAGKNQTRTFVPEMQVKANTRHQVQARLRRAIDMGELCVWFQPKVDAATRRPVGCEALVRWITPDGKMVSPAEFIPVAEQTGLIGPLGITVFRLAAQQAKQWADLGHEPAIAVNVSPAQLRHPRFIEQLTDLLEETGTQASWFELEITENAMMSDVAHATAIIDQLAELGFRVAIDDFGTGYSSLSYLTTFNIHTLKIDLSFVREMTHDAQSNAVVRSIISLGNGLGLKLVAEGVETEAQAKLLTEAGCTLLQGYLFGKPMPAEDYWSWYLERMRESVGE
ncbi:MAG: EAL domain-containing protein [Pirellulaceae bacterium]